MGDIAPSMTVPQEAPGTTTKVFGDWQKHFEAPAQSTNTALVTSLRSRYLGWSLTVTPNSSTGLLSFAKAGHATAALDTKYETSLSFRTYKAAKGRISNDPGTIKDRVTFGKYDYTWESQSYIIYNAAFTEGYNREDNLYILSKLPDGYSGPATVSPQHVDDLIIAATKWNSELHNEILVFDQQMWLKDAELYRSVQSASWDDVILDKGMKDSLIKDVETFFDCRAEYKKYAVPWKRGIIFHGTPGNGKTISIKALMNSLAMRKDSIPSLYVKSLAGCSNAYYAIRQIFVTARQYSPCILIFEDLDSLIDDNVKSFFLNEVDGLEDNDGLMMIGSTNYLERLDAGISKRPGRFDRKYHFTLPAAPERAAYCEYWRQKLAKNDNDLEYPESLNAKIAEITENFSFAYIKEAFVTSLLTIVGSQKGTNKADEELEPAATGTDDLDDNNLLWRIMKKQVETLRVEMEGARKSAEEAGPEKAGQKCSGDFHQTNILRAENDNADDLK